MDFARSSGRVSAPRRNSSAYPRIDVSGVRSSCDASATNRRRRSSERRRCSKAASIRASIVLRAIPSRPTSVRSSAGSTRRVRSPAAMASAVLPIPSSGCMPTRTSHKASPATMRSTIALTRNSTPIRCRSVSSVSGIATTIVPVAGCPFCVNCTSLASTRYRVEPSSDRTVMGAESPGDHIGSWAGKVGGEPSGPRKRWRTVFPDPSSTAT